MIEVLSEVTNSQSQHFLKIFSFYSSSEAEKMLVARTFEKNLRFEKKLEDEFGFEKTFIWWHSLVRKTQIFWEISDLRKSQRWWPRGQLTLDLRRLVLINMFHEQKQQWQSNWRILRTYPNLKIKSIYVLNSTDSDCLIIFRSKELIYLYIWYTYRLNNRLFHFEIWLVRIIL